jgi:putative membrane protein
VGIAVAALFGLRPGRFADRPHWIGIVLLVLVAALIVAAIVAIIVSLTRGHPAGAGPAAPVAPGAATTSVAGPGLDARRILDERLARGEIDPEEYRLRRSALEGGSSTGGG